MPDAKYANTLLQSFDSELIDRLHLKSVAFKVGQEIEFPGKPIKHLPFLEEGMASMTTTFKNGSEVEVGMFGYESVIGVSALMGSALNSRWCHEPLREAMTNQWGIISLPSLSPPSARFFVTFTISGHQHKSSPNCLSNNCVASWRCSDENNTARSHGTVNSAPIAPRRISVIRSDKSRAQNVG